MATRHRYACSTFFRTPANESSGNLIDNYQIFRMLMRIFVSISMYQYSAKCKSSTSFYMIFFFESTIAQPSIFIPVIRIGLTIATSYKRRLLSMDNVECLPDSRSRPLLFWLLFCKDDDNFMDYN